MSTEPAQDRDRDSLCPDMRRKADAIFTQLCAEGYHPIITETGRTAERQKWLRAHGRSKIVRSKHQDGRATDFAFSVKGKATFSRTYSGYARLGKLARDHGCKWGGAWRFFKDIYHIELP
jgi:hypothetical protein